MYAVVALCSQAAGQGPDGGGAWLQKRRAAATKVCAVVTHRRADRQADRQAAEFNKRAPLLLTAARKQPTKLCWTQIAVGSPVAPDGLQSVGSPCGQSSVFKAIADVILAIAACQPGSNCPTIQHSCGGGITALSPPGQCFLYYENLCTAYRPAPVHHFSPTFH